MEVCIFGESALDCTYLIEAVSTVMLCWLTDGALKASFIAQTSFLRQSSKICHRGSHRTLRAALSVCIAWQLDRR